MHFGIVAVAAVVAVVAVLAATAQNVNTSFDITYTVTDVSASVSAKTFVQGDASATAMTGGTDGVLTFTADQATTSGTLSAGDIVLTTAKKYVVFEYKFVNNSSSKAFTVALNEDGVTATNMKSAKYKVSTTEIATKDYVAQITDASLTTPTVATSGTSYVYVLVEIDNIANDAAYTGSHAWTLSAVTA